MKFEERQYQNNTVDAWFKSLVEEEKRAVVAVPTGAGKTVIMAKLIKKYIKLHPANKVVVLSHTQDILEQDFVALLELFPGEDIGLYSAGLGSSDIGQITVAGIQSVHKKFEEFKWTNLFIIDEVHAVNHKDTGMYRNFLRDSHALIGGMSATVFRSGHGMIYENNELFTTLAYDLTSVHNFNLLIKEGYLTNLISLATGTTYDTTDVKLSAGDYNTKSLSEQLDRGELTSCITEELVKFGKNYKKWLVFAIDTNHADNICAELLKQGVDAQVLHSKMNHDRQKTTKRFKKGQTRALVSVGMVTTGFDAPNVDLIALMRPTRSAVLHVQMIGRGLRTAPGKDHCLVLDFAGNTSRLGPINDVRIPVKPGKRKDNSDVENPIKVCPNCKTMLPPSVKFCTTCQHEFVFKTALSTAIDTGKLIRTEDDKVEVKKWLSVSSIQYNIHNKPGSPSSLLVTYHCGLQKIKDWVCLDHKGYAKVKADHWVKMRGYTGVNTTEAVFRSNNKLKKPQRILVDFSSRYPSVVNAEFN